MPERDSTRLDYGRRIARAMAYVAANLDAPLDLARVAEEGAFSPWHFHRIFRGLAGETLAEHISRLRLSRAAKDLIDGHLTLARIARRAGYSGLPAFARAFRAAYGMPPAAYRARGGMGRILPSPTPTPTTEETAMFHIADRDYPALRLAALLHVGPYAQMGTAFDRLSAWAGSHGLITAETRFFGRYLDDPTAVPESQLRSEACLTLPAGVALPDAGALQLALVDLPAFQAAVIRFKGPYAELEPAYGWLYGTWLPQSGREAADLPVMEEYLNDPRTLPPAEWLTDIILPMKVGVATLAVPA